MALKRIHSQHNLMYVEDKISLEITWISLYRLIIEYVKIPESLGGIRLTYVCR